MNPDNRDFERTKAIVDLQATEANANKIANAVATDARRIMGHTATSPIEFALTELMTGTPDTYHARRFREELVGRAAAALGFDLVPVAQEEEE